MINVSKLSFLKKISESERLESLNILDNFFTDRGCKLLDVIYHSSNYPVKVIFSKNGNKQVLKVPMITFEKYHLINTLGYIFDSLEKRGTFK